MELFIEKDGMPVVNPEVKIIPCFNQLFKRDKGSPGDYDGRLKLLANRTLAYIALMYRPIGAYWDREPAERHRLIKKDLKLPEEWAVDNLIQECIDLYIERNVNFNVELLDAAMVGAYKVKDYYMTVDLTEETSRGALKHKAGDLLNNVKNVGGVISGIEDLKDAIKRDASNNVVIRGGGTKGRDEDPR